MPDALKISIITPSFNSAPYIAAAIESVLAQGYADFEHIIVDGGSKDGTVEILERYPHLKWVSEPDRGQSHAMNKGFAMSSGGIVGYLNADDWYEPDAFRKVAAVFAARPEIGFVVGRLKVVNAQGSHWINDPKTTFEEMLRWWEPNAYPYNPAAYFYRREVQEKVGGFNEQNHNTMDWEFLLDVARIAGFEKIDALLGDFRLIEGTKTFSTKGIEHMKAKFAASERYAALLSEAERAAFLRAERDYLERTERESKGLPALLRRLRRLRGGLGRFLRGLVGR